jgi:class 3 adenylate cyclase
MAKLDPRKRANLPDSAFAYVDSRGRRRLPINDESHVRNALSRFNQVSFENEEAKERARNRLLKAAKKYGIVPVGFIASQIESERRHASKSALRDLPTGFLTMMMTDIEGSTALLRKVGDRYATLLDDVRVILHDAVIRAGGRQIDARADDSFAVFEHPAAALEAAATLQRAIASRAWPESVSVRVRVGIHSGEPTLAKVGYIGLPVHTTARICAAAHGGQVLVSGPTVTASGDTVASGVRFRSLGPHRLSGLPEPEELYQLEADGLANVFDPPRTRGVFGINTGEAGD